MTKGDLELGYWLPFTQFAVNTTKRYIVVAGDSGSYKQLAADVSLVPTAIADPKSRMTLNIDVRALEKVSLAVNLDDRGFIQSVNSESSKDLAPVMSVVGKAIGLAAAIVAFGPDENIPTASMSLEAEWALKYPLLSQNAAALEVKIAEYLQKVGDPSTLPQDVVHVGAALEALQNQLATISQAKRTWIAAQAGPSTTQGWKYAPEDLMALNGELPVTLLEPAIPPQQTDMAGQFGVLVAIVDPDRTGVSRTADGSLVDRIVLRRSRPVTVGVYFRDEKDWKLDESSVRQLDVVDGHSELDQLSLDGSWLKTKRFELSYHPDMSVKSFGVTTAPNASAVATSLGEILDATSVARKQIAERPAAAEQRLKAATLQLDLLKTASEYEVLAATHRESEELAILELRKRLREATRGA
ncbi:hypothetical protein [Actinoplanes aureus]|uniref:Uncharacterized protein n=1 Tax=Actinoplanes aureus TaxID=2792083 RepID=A0A931CJC7_9ACTN|nr:hypothetical protein [Actinoplanes aureus]MBG0568418.1 hypothetical protein [Actinoplanes aureus]